MVKALPTSEKDLNTILKRIEALLASSDSPAALTLCQALIDQELTRRAGLRARADVYASLRQRDLQIADLEHLVAEGYECYPPGGVRTKEQLMVEIVGRTP